MANKMKEKKQPRVFYMVRNNDESGTSGTGIVLYGIEFPNGKCAVCWHTDKGIDSVSVFDSFDEFMKIHVKQHPTNDTEIVWKKITGNEKPQLAKDLGY